MASPRRPLCVIMGGAKVADKIGVLWAMIAKADVVVVGGRMAFTFLAAIGVCVGETQVGGCWAGWLTLPTAVLLLAATLRCHPCTLPRSPGKSPCSRRSS